MVTIHLVSKYNNISRLYNYLIYYINMDEMIVHNSSVNLCRRKLCHNGNDPQNLDVDAKSCFMLCFSPISKYSILCPLVTGCHSDGNSIGSFGFLRETSYFILCIIFMRVN